MNFCSLTAMKRIRLALLTLPLLALSGCSGINASKSISPLDFLLPGLHMRNDSPSCPAAPDDNNAPPSFIPPGLPQPTLC